MLKKLLVVSLLLGTVFSPELAFAQNGGMGNVTEPVGAARAVQYKKVLENCRKRFGGSASISAEWGVHFGKHGWWCATRR